MGGEFLECWLGYCLGLFVHFIVVIGGGMMVFFLDGFALDDARSNGGWGVVA